MGPVTRAAALPLLAAIATATATVAIGDETKPASPPSPPSLKLEPSKAVEITCYSKSVVVADNAANATNGTLRLSLLLKDAAAKPQTGAWRVVDVEAGHAGSFAKREMKTCAEACPLTIAADGQIELWAPAQKGIDQLADKEMLFLAVIKTATLDLRATTFSGKQIESLEEATCRIGT